MKPKALLALALCQAAVCAMAAQAQSINQLVAFGDSSIDSGWLKNTTSGDSHTDSLIAAAVAQGGNTAWSSNGLTSANYLAAHFGTTALPANQSGGTNYAIGGSFAAIPNAGTGYGFLTGIGAATQISNYLASVHGAANPNAIYLISTGGNDLAYAAQRAGIWSATQTTDFLASESTGLANAIAGLQAAGARYIVVNSSLPTTFWTSLTAQGVHYIASDNGSAIGAAATNPGSFGITTTAPGVAGTANTGACIPQGGWTASWSVLCSPASLASPNASQTYLWADNWHLSGAGHEIVGDYMYNLIAAPSEISYLPETAVMERRQVLRSIRGQMTASRDKSDGLRLWVSGNMASQSLKSGDQAMSNLDSQPNAIIIGGEDRVSDDLVVGGAYSFSLQSAHYSLGGHYTQTEHSGSLFALYDDGQLWADLVGGYGSLGYRSQRLAKVGSSFQWNKGVAHGYDLSASAEAGWHFTTAGLVHGPLVGVTWQSVHIDAFLETGSFTSLAFGSQSRPSLVGTVGYQASLPLARAMPFVQVAVNQEFDGGSRQVSAWLTTIAAPPYSLPAFQPGRTWGTGTIGLRYALSDQLIAVASFSADLGQKRASTYGGQFGLNFAL